MKGIDGKWEGSTEIKEYHRNVHYDHKIWEVSQLQTSITVLLLTIVLLTEFQKTKIHLSSENQVL